MSNQRYGKEGRREGEKEGRREGGKKGKRGGRKEGGKFIGGWKVNVRVISLQREKWAGLHMYCTCTTYTHAWMHDTLIKYCAVFSLDS